jgi:hypothetical protein
MTLRTHRRLAALGTVVSLAVAAPGLPARADVIDGHTLVQMCRDITESECLGYVNGVVDALAASNGRMLDARACLPRAGVDALAAVGIVEKYLKASPEFRRFPAPNLVVFAVADAYPCKGSAAPGTDASNLGR